MEGVHASRRADSRRIEQPGRVVMRARYFVFGPAARPLPPSGKTGRGDWSR
jgi:hypothetical protein